MLQKTARILSALLALCLLAAPVRAQPAHPALSPADREERAFIFYHALVASMRGARGELREAAKMFDEIARHTQSPELARQAVAAAEAAGDFAAAARYARAWKKFGGGSESQIRAAAALVQAGNLAAAEPLLRELSARDALPPEVIYNILAAAEDADQVLPVAGRLFGGGENGAPPADPEAAYQYGRLAARVGRLDFAKKLFAAAAENAATPEPHFALALVDENAAGLAAAVARLDDYRRRECPGADPARCHESYVLYAYRRFAGGHRDWRGALNGDDRAPDLQARARLVAGETLEEGEMPKRAAAQYAEAPPGEFYFRARMGMARIARDNGDNNLALEILDATPTGDQREFVRREMTAAEILKRRDGPAPALKRIADARKVAPNDGGLLYQHSLYAEETGQVGLAVALLGKMTSLFPDDPDGWNALGYVMADHKLNLPEARAHITRALRMKPDDPNILDSLGWVHYRLGNLELARRHLEEAVKKWEAERRSSPPVAAEILAHLGEVLWELGEREAAREVWRRALASGDANPVLNETIARYRPF